MNYGWTFLTLYKRQGSTIPMGKKCKKEKWLPEETLQIALKRREVKGKEKGKDTPTAMQSSKE